MVTHEVERGGPAIASLNESGENGEQGGEEFSQLVTCRVDREEYAIDILSVQEINRMVEITRVPKAPSFVEGVINLRGRIIPVLDLRRRFGLPEAEHTEGSRIVVVTVRGRVIGLIVDCVMEVLRIPKSRIEPPPSMGSTAGTEFTQGVGKMNDRLLTVLDLDRLLATSENGALVGA